MTGHLVIGIRFPAVGAIMVHSKGPWEIPVPREKQKFGWIGWHNRNLGSEQAPWELPVPQGIQGTPG